MPKQPIFKFKYKNYFNDGLTFTGKKGDYSISNDKILGVRGQFFPKGKVLGKTLDVKFSRK